jgi:nucleoside-diphosphate-sugar epimerase
MRAVVIGGLGPIGYSLCYQLIEEEIEVLALDNNFENDELKEERLLLIGRNANFQIEHLDSDYRSIDEKFDVIFYCAYNPEERQLSSEKLLTNALEYCHDYGSKFVLVSCNGGFDENTEEIDKEKHPSSDANHDKVFLQQEKIVFESFKANEDQFIILRFISGDEDTVKLKQNRTIYVEIEKSNPEYLSPSSSKVVGIKSFNFAEWLKNGLIKED